MKTLFLILGLFGVSMLAQATSPMPPLLIDVRTVQEYQAGHVEGAINIPYDVIAEKITEVNGENLGRPVFLYCRSGHRAGIALQTLSDLGYTQVHNLGSMEEANAYLANHPSLVPAPVN